MAVDEGGRDLAKYERKVMKAKGNHSASRSSPRWSSEGTFPLCLPVPPHHLDKWPTCSYILLLGGSRALPIDQVRDTPIHTYARGT